MFDKRKNIQIGEKKRNNKFLVVRRCLNLDLKKFDPLTLFGHVDQLLYIFYRLCEFRF